MKYSLNALKQEFLMRKFRRDSSNNVVGIEIKDRRLNLSTTLQSLSSDICSPSYLCKIENNKIAPNKIFLKEICKRLELKPEKVNTLLKLKITLEDVVKAFLLGNVDYIEEAYYSGLGLKNYRYRIIEFIYFIIKKDLYSANNTYSELIRLVSSMMDSDLIVFAIFSGILSFYNQEFEEALDNFNALSLTRGISTEEMLLCQKYKLYIEFILNNPCCLLEYKKLIWAYASEGHTEGLDEAHYIIGLYLLRQRQFMEYKNIYRIIHKKEYKRSLSLLVKIIFNPNIKIKKEWLENIRPFYYYLGLIYSDYDTAVEKISQMNDLSFSYDFNLLYLQYLLLKEDKDKYIFITQNAIPTIERTKDGYAKEFFLEQLCILCGKMARYKVFQQTYKQLKEK